MDISLHTRTLKKILQEHFKGETPIVRYDFKEQNQFLAAIKEKLRMMDGFELSEEERFYPRFFASEFKETCLFTIHSSSKYYSSQDFVLKFNDMNVFIINANYNINSPVYDLEQIYTFSDKMESEYKRLDKIYVRTEKTREKNKAERHKQKENNSIKRKKVKSLKEKAIFAKINEIAKEDKFEFYIEKYITKVKLMVRLTKTEQMEIDIPYGKFQEALQNLRVTIKTIQELRDSGIVFKIRRVSYRDTQWISFDADKQ